MVYHAEMVARAAAGTCGGRPAVPSYHASPPGLSLGRPVAQGDGLSGREARRRPADGRDHRGRGRGGDSRDGPHRPDAPVDPPAGCYKVQRSGEEILGRCQGCGRGGAFAVVLECVPARSAATITADSPIPTIGIGAGPQCDGQVLVIHDMLGLLGEFPAPVRPPLRRAWRGHPHRRRRLYSRRQNGLISR